MYYYFMLWVDNKLSATKSQLHPKKLINNEGKNIFFFRKNLFPKSNQRRQPREDIESYQHGTKGQVKLITLFCNKQNF